jgi:predicted nucleotidyltransferase
MGINSFEQQDGGWEEDKVIYDLRKAMRLMADCNPNMIEMLWIPERFWLDSSTYWRRLIHYRHKFLSKKLRYTYGGYAFAQLKRIQRHRGYLLDPPKKKPERSDFHLPEEKLVTDDQMGAFQWVLAKLLEDSIELMRLSDTTKEELKGINYIGAVQSGIPEESWTTIQKLTGATDQWMEAIIKEKRYSQALKHWNSYQSWKKTRNLARAELEKKYGYDVKHAMHLVRLMKTGLEVLESGEIQVYRDDREELLAIRNGAWSYDEVVEFATECEKDLDELYKETRLPKNADRKFLDSLCQEIIEEYVFNEET